MFKDLRYPEYVDGHGWYVPTVRDIHGNCEYLHTDLDLYELTTPTGSSTGFFKTRTHALDARSDYYDSHGKVDNMVEPVTSNPLFFKW